MTQKIHGEGFRPVDTAGPRRADAAKSPKTSAGDDTATQSPARADDTVNLTSTGVLMSKLEEVVQSTPAVDGARVQAVKDALAAGTYEVDDQKVADKLLRLDRELTG